MPATDTGYKTTTWLKDTNEKEIHMGEFWGRKEKKWLQETQIKGVKSNIAIYAKLIDWDNDGDLDLLMGGRLGNLGLRINEGSPKEPKFSASPQVLKASGKVITLGSSATIEMADLNNDGLNDLISGDNTGTITIYLNSGSKEQPLFTNPIKIKADLANNNRPAKYCSVSVIDYNNDGKKDILIGAISPKKQCGIWAMYQK